MSITGVNMKKLMFFVIFGLLGCGAGSSFIVKSNDTSECYHLLNTTPKLGSYVSWTDLVGNRRVFREADGTTVQDYTISTVPDDNFKMTEDRLHIENGSCHNGLQ